jgi:hypothetical protein
VPVTRSLRRLLDSPSAANVGLVVIVVGMVLLSAKHTGRMPLDSVHCWWIVATGWSLFALHLVRVRMNACRALMRRAAIVAAAVTAMTMLPYGQFSDDMLRYQWDGNLSVHRVSPYQTVPIDPALALFAFSNGDVSLPTELPYADMRTVYPPGAQVVFALASGVSGGDSRRWKFVFWILCLLTAGGVWLLSTHNQRPWLILAGLSPLVLLHGWVDAHLDLLMALLSVMAIQLRSGNKLVGAGGIIALAISIKYLPVLLVPALCFGLNLRQIAALLCSAAVVIAAVFAPFIGDHVIGSLGVFTSSWQANSGAYTLIATVLEPSAARVSLLILFIVASTLVVLRHYSRPYHAVALVLMSLAVFSPVVHPWYLIPSVLLLPWAPLRSTLVWSMTMSFYGVVLQTYKSNGVWMEHPVALALEFIPVVIAYIIDVRQGPLPLMDQK